MSNRLLNTLGFFFLIVLLLTIIRRTSGFRGGEGIGGRTDGPAASTLSPATFEGFRDGSTTFDVKGKSEVNPDSGPANASLLQPRKPYHLLSDVLQDAPRDTIGCLRAGCCNETDFEARTNLTGNYLQRTNNYKRVYPDNCSGWLHDFTMAFYKTTPLKAE